mmetsp:Transcript_21631/g.65640  ORF Transcript_21631/g.65640 Transcript_21631/m.65640 type:complete len:205 (+) Transcript_21631:1838-2452(+)
MWETHTIGKPRSRLLRPVTAWISLRVKKASGGSDCRGPSTPPPAWNSTIHCAERSAMAPDSRTDDISPPPRSAHVRRALSVTVVERSGGMCGGPGFRMVPSAAPPLGLPRTERSRTGEMPSSGLGPPRRDLNILPATPDPDASCFAARDAETDVSCPACARISFRRSSLEMLRSAGSSTTFCIAESFLLDADDPLLADCPELGA